jgi:hypothetical protein
MGIRKKRKTCLNHRPREEQIFDAMEAEHDQHLLLQPVGHAQDELAWQDLFGRK